MLYTHMTQPEFIVRYHWEPGTIAFWDNPDDALRHLRLRQRPARHAPRQSSAATARPDLAELASQPNCFA